MVGADAVAIVPDGSTTSFDVRVHPVGDEARARDGAVPDPTGPPRTVLVADDDLDLVRLIARRLTKAGFDVITAADGAEALQLAQRALPDLVLLDVMMPRLTGIEVMRELAADPATRTIAVILASASLPERPASDEGFAGADDYIRKPFGPTEIPDRVRDVLERTGAT